MRIVSYMIVALIFSFLSITVAQQIVIDPVTKKIYIVTGDTVPAPTPTPTPVVTGTTVMTAAVTTAVVAPVPTATPVMTAATASVTTAAVVTTPTSPVITWSMNYSQEFADALAWMYKNGLTKYSNPSEYRPKDFLTREEASKIVGQSYAVLWFPQWTKQSDCTFSDANMFDPSLATFIANVCQRWLFKWSNGKFMPQDPLTNPQTIAVLVRMFEGKLSDETKRPWRNDYYQKGKIIWLIDTVDWNVFDTKITREQVAIYVYRLNNIIQNEKLKIASLNAMNQIDNPQAISGVDSDMMMDNLGLIAGGLTAIVDPELQEAIQWMYDSKITQYNKPEEYRPYALLLREEAAKMLDSFTKVFTLQAGLKDAVLLNECYFSDEQEVDLSLLDSVKNVCRLGLLKGVKNKFYPKVTITKAHFVAALIRLFEGKALDETQTPRWKNYFQKAQELGIVAPIDAITFDTPITRYEVAIFLYRFKVKYLLLQGMNSNRLQNEIISTVPGSQKVWSNNRQEANVYVDANKLDDQNFEIGFIELFGTRYKIVKTKYEKYFTNNFVRYGDLFDLDEDKNVGTISMIVSNGYLVEGTVRRDGKIENYMIRPNPDTQAYYRLTIE